MRHKLFDETIDALSASRRNVRCDELASHLRRLGFEVRDGRKGGHKLIFHDGIPNFIAGSYNCGHGRNPEIKPAYVSVILKLLDKYKQEIIRYLETHRP